MVASTLVLGHEEVGKPVRHKALPLILPLHVYKVSNSGRYQHPSQLHFDQFWPPEKLLACTNLISLSSCTCAVASAAARVNKLPQQAAYAMLDGELEPD